MEAVRLVRATCGPVDERSTDGSTLPSAECVPQLGGGDGLFDRQIELDGDWGIEINPFLGGPQRDDQRIAHAPIDAVLALVVLPPPTDRVDGKDALRRQFGTRALPDVLV